MKRSGCRALLVLSSLSALLCIFYIFLDPTLYLQDPQPAVPQRNLSILLWRWPFGRSYRLDGDKCLEMYNIHRCFLTDDTSTFSTADVVVFHHQELKEGLSALPLHLDRPASQHWVWLSMEPPVNNANLTPLSGIFNWTMSYRRDADIYIPYGKTVYGKWNNKPLSDKKLLPTIAKCAFYLSFENSEAKDYISEKLWRNALQAGVVPVVLGPSRATYEAMAPPGSFIHVADFKNTADLAAYLKQVAADRQAYEEFFQWHHTHRIKTFTDWRERLCQICVHFPGLAASRVYQDLESWVHS
ncbi:hypothetical protein CgunFtcFv8_003570 [Champsocephalus gunnari]|uniref:Fucosyltransferase n=1 Tax=Champsocephalus gunnari TaxID=52237 RepID=A0AAN8E3D5_CHAGU|nr:hypothetical protein CgunFtcFv8_003570 [Champsocephalus gunnari]